MFRPPVGTGRFQNDTGILTNDRPEPSDDPGILPNDPPERPDDLGILPKGTGRFQNNQGILADDLPFLLQYQSFTGF
jgi:hypothetical protein